MEITASKFMDIQRAIQPDWFQCISDGDTISGEVSRKRAKKSVDRSLSFLDACLQLLEKSPVRSQRCHTYKYLIEIYMCVCVYIRTGCFPSTTFFS